MWGSGPGWGMMGPWGSGFGTGPFGMILWLVIIILIVAVVVWFLRSGGSRRPAQLEQRSSGLDVLEERYARGEINRDEYLQKKRDISG
jgi:putative membrane protein